MSVDRHVWLEINLSAIRNNVRKIQSVLGPGVRFCAVLKDDSYGHGALAVAKEIAPLGVDYLGVALLQEALALRAAGHTLPVLIFGHTPPELSALVAGHHLTQTVFSLEQARALSSAAVNLGLKAKVHAKIDTGMARLGVRPEEAGEFCAALAALPGLDLEGMYTHFATADSDDKTYAQKQLAAFRVADEAVKGKGLRLKLRHCANSAATMTMPEAHFDMARSGSTLYGGLYPFETARHNNWPAELEGAMEMKARIIQIKELPAGSSVSYGATFTAPRDMRLGTLPVGYGDGYSRMLSGKIKVLAGGQKVAQVGRICMDQCMIDLTDAPQVKVGDEVLLFGAKLPVSQLADQLGTIEYEVTTMIRRRVPRVYI